jgi:hypothetical protein
MAPGHSGGLTAVTTVELEINRANPTRKSENLQCTHADQRPKETTVADHGLVIP